MAYSDMCQHQGQLETVKAVADWYSNFRQLYTNKITAEQLKYIADSCNTLQTVAIHCRQLQYIADMFVLICSVRLKRVHLDNGAFQAKAILKLDRVGPVDSRPSTN